METTSNRTARLATALVAAAALVACAPSAPDASDGGAEATGGDAASAESASSGDAETSGMPASLWSNEPLAGAVDVVDLRESAKDGDQVVLRGTLQDFGRSATFRLVEDSLLDCSEKHDDVCPTPWDYCCEDPTRLRSLTVNVEFLDGEFPAAWTLDGEHGLDHLSEVTVAGVVRFDEQGNIRLEAERMARQ